MLTKYASNQIRSLNAPLCIKVSTKRSHFNFNKFKKLQERQQSCVFKYRFYLSISIYKITIINIYNDYSR